MNRITAIAATGFLCLASGLASAQTQSPQSQSQGQPPVAGKTPLGVTVTEMDTIVSGWSAKKSLMGKNVVNDQNAKVGSIDDIIIAPDRWVSYAIIGTGGFVGMGKHDVAIPMEQIKLQNGKLVLPGATKDALKRLPEFEYSKK